MPNSESRRDLIQRVWAAAWDDGDVDALDDLLSEAYVRNGHDDSTQGRDEFKAAILGTRSAFPDLVTNVDDVVIEGDRAAIRWHSAGKHDHSFLGVPATKRPVQVSGATFALFDGEKIVEEHVTWDPRSLLTALGIISVGQD